MFDDLNNRLDESKPQPRLEPVMRVLDLLGEPQKSYKIITVTGTNGKTSVSRMIAALANSMGIRVGLLTSPHISKLNERFVINNENITDDQLEYIYQDIKPYIDMVDAELYKKGENKLSYFELITLLAFAAFAEATVDLAVLEVGMGGSWDATNAADADVAVFTPISFDHESRLGFTLSEIADTKAGIIKPGSSVVSSSQNEEVLEIIKTKAFSVGSDVRVDDNNLTFSSGVGGQLFSWTSEYGNYSGIWINQYGDYQVYNAILAISALEEFMGKRSIASDIVAEAFANLDNPGRIQIIANNPLIIFDGAHNPHGVENLLNSLPKFFSDKEWLVLAGFSADKNHSEMIRLLFSFTNELFLTSFDNVRSASNEDLFSAVNSANLSSEKNINFFNYLPDALQASIKWANGSSSSRAILVLGSFMLLGESKLYLESNYDE